MSIDWSEYRPGRRSGCSARCCPGVPAGHNDTCVGPRLTQPCRTHEGHPIRKRLRMVLPDRIELSTSPLSRRKSTRVYGP
jgi:hypothetical protein